jgi:hypothetical protein
VDYLTPSYSLGSKLIASGSEATGEAEDRDTEVALEAPSDAVDTVVTLGAPVDGEMTLETLLANVELDTPFYIKKGLLD